MRRPVCLLALLFAAAVWAAVLIFPAGERIDEKADGRSVTVSGTVEWKEYALAAPDDFTIQLTLKNIRIESGIPAEIGFDVFRDDKVLCILSDDPALQESWAKEGARVRVKGKLRLYRHPSNDGEFDAFLHYSQIRGYLFSLRDAHILGFTSSKATMKSRLYSVRQMLSDALDQIYDANGTAAFYERPSSGPDRAAIMKAMLLGQTSLLGADEKDRYQSAGIIHILCISGVHLTLIGTGIFGILRKAGVPMPLSCAVPTFFLFFYGLLTGMHTSCIRALVMFSLRAAAKALGRTYDSMTALAVAAILLLIEQPAYLYHSGFLFSFAAVIGIGLVMEAFPKKAAPLLVPVCTLPVQLSFYYTFPLYSVFLNLVVIALAPFLIAGGMLSLIVYLPALLLSGGAPGGVSGSIQGFSALLLGISRMIGKVPCVILYLFDRLCTAAERLPFHTLIPGRPALWLVIVYYLLVTAAAAAGLCRKNIENTNTWKMAALQAALTTAAVAMILGIRYRSPFSMYMWNVGQGDGLCLITHDESGSRCVLVDGGSSSRQGIGKYVEIPFLKYHGISRIDCCVVTHDDLDHCSGVMELLSQHGEADGIRIGSVALPSVSKDRKGKLYQEIETTAKKKGIPVISMYRGMTLSQGPLCLSCIHPGQNADYEDANAYSVVLVAKYRNYTALLTGDLEGDGERDLIDYLGQSRIEADVLKVAHHGSEGGTSQSFLRKAGAKTALISCGKDNPYGHPSPGTLERLRKAGMKVYDTRTAGQISILTDGRDGYSIKTFFP